MPQLPAWSAASFIHGVTQKSIAKECGKGEKAVYLWATGRTRCPAQSRASVDRAMKSEVDWVAYDLEFDRLNGTSPDLTGNDVLSETAQNGPPEAIPPTAAPTPTPAPQAAPAPAPAAPAPISATQSPEIDAETREFNDYYGI